MSDAFLVFAIPIAGLALLVLTMGNGTGDVSETRGAQRRPEAERTIAWLLVLGFGLYVYLAMGFFAFLPKFIHTHPNALFPPGVVALFAPAGSLAAAAVLAKWRGPSSLVLATMGFSGIAASALFIFSTQAYSGVAMAIYASRNQPQKQKLTEWVVEAQYLAKRFDLNGSGLRVPGRPHYVAQAAPCQPRAR